MTDTLPLMPDDIALELGRRALEIVGLRAMVRRLQAQIDEQAQQVDQGDAGESEAG